VSIADPPAELLDPPEPTLFAMPPFAAPVSCPGVPVCDPQALSSRTKRASVAAFRVKGLLRHAVARVQQFELNSFSARVAASSQ